MSLPMNLRISFSLVFFNLLLGCNSKVYKCSLPLENGIVFKNQFKSYDEDGNVLMIFSRANLAKSYISGKVYSVIDVGDEVGIVIHSGNCMYTFSNLKKAFVHKGSLIRIGDVLGTVRKNIDRYEVWLQKTCEGNKINNIQIYEELKKAR